MDGVFLSPTEDEFVGRISEELEHFLLQGQHQRVLLFPPLSSRLRYLIHRTVENMELLSSFSVGEGWRRRTVICHSAVRLPKEGPAEQPRPGAGPARGPRPPPPWARGSRGLPRLRPPGDSPGDTARTSVGSGRISRPPRKKGDRALFVPRGGRRKANWRERDGPGEEAEAGGEKWPKNPARMELGKDGGNPKEEVEEGREKCLKNPSRMELGKDGGGPKEAEGENVPENGGAEGAVREEEEEEVEFPSLGNSWRQEIRDEDCSHPLPPEHHKEPEQMSPAVLPEGRESQQGKQPSCDPRGSELEENPFPLENHAGTREPQSLESSRDKAKQEGAPTAEQNPGNAEGNQGSFSTQESPQLQEEQEPPQNMGAGPGEAEAAPEPLPGADPSGKGLTEGEQDKDVAQERGLAAGDTEGTRQSPEDDTAELLAEIVGNLTVQDVSIERISVDYCSYGEPPVTEEDLGHVTEIYDFPPSLKTEDLMGFFSDFHESGFKIQWVDETHALGIFSSPSTASQALGRRYPNLRLRPLLHASRQAKLRALQRPKLLQLGKERPQTDPAVARRLLSHALGWRQRQHEAEVFQPQSLEQEE